MRTRFTAAGLAACLAAMAGMAAGVSAQSFQPALAPGDVISWRSAEGIKRLERSRHKVDFFALANNYESQSNRLLCGPTSGIIVLNALRGRGHNAGNPEDPAAFDDQARPYLPEGFDPLYPRYTQNTFFNAATDRVKTRLQVYGQPVTPTAGHDYGLQLSQLSRMLEAHGLAVTERIADGGLSRGFIKAELVNNLSRPDDYVIVNYARQSVGQPGGGHFSPLAAYDAGSDSFLVMDTVPAVADWAWIKAEVLIAAMNTRDVSDNRGYLLISD